MVAVHLFLKNRLQRTGFRVFSKHANPIVFDVSGNEEREALNMVPMGMGIEKSQAERGGTGPGQDIGNTLGSGHG